MGRAPQDWELFLGQRGAVGIDVRDQIMEMLRGQVEGSEWHLVDMGSHGRFGRKGQQNPSWSPARKEGRQ